MGLRLLVLVGVLLFFVAEVSTIDAEAEKMMSKSVVRGNNRTIDNRISTRVSFMLWLSMHNRISTIDNLQKRGWSLVNRCYFCKSVAEDTNHLLLHCPMAYDLWNWFLSNLGIGWSQQSTFRRCMESWRIVGIHDHRADIWRVMPAAIAWSLWLERNQRAFESKEGDFARLVIVMGCALHGVACIQGRIGAAGLVGHAA